MNQLLLIFRAQISVVGANLGLSGWVGVALMLAAAFGFNWHQQKLATLGELQSSLELVTARKPLAPAPAVPVAQGTNPRTEAPGLIDRQALQETLADLPMREARNVVKAAELAAYAAKRGVRLSSVEYKWLRSASRTSPIQRLDLSMTASGSYPQIRMWINELLVKHPNGQVLEATIERRDAESPLEARLVLGLHFRSVPVKTS